MLAVHNHQQLELISNYNLTQDRLNISDHVISQCIDQSSFSGIQAHRLHVFSSAGDRRHTETHRSSQLERVQMSLTRTHSAVWNPLASLDMSWIGDSILVKPRIQDNYHWVNHNAVEVELSHKSRPFARTVGQSVETG